LITIDELLASERARMVERRSIASELLTTRAECLDLAGT
jgi:hypothetical protein